MKKSDFDLAGHLLGYRLKLKGNDLINVEYLTLRNIAEAHLNDQVYRDLFKHRAQKIHKFDAQLEV